MNLQGQYKTAMRHYREASKRDGSNVQAVEGMMLSQILDGDIAEAEGQIELLQVMQSSPEEASVHHLFLEALMARMSHNPSMSLHLEKLSECRQRFEIQCSKENISLLKPLSEYVLCDPDFTIVLAAEFLVHMESPVPLLFSAPATRDSAKAKYLGGGRPLSALTNKGDMSSLGGVVKLGISPEVSSAVLAGVGILQQLLKRFPGLIVIYIELARILSAQSKFDDACKCLRQCLALQPHCGAALVTLAKTECARFNTTAASHALEQALSSGKRTSQTRDCFSDLP